MGESLCGRLLSSLSSLAAQRTLCSAGRDNDNTWVQEVVRAKPLRMVLDLAHSATLATRKVLRIFCSQARLREAPADRRRMERERAPRQNLTRLWSARYL
eukprot:6464044-Amphidinium_carterae.1